MSTEKTDQSVERMGTTFPFEKVIVFLSIIVLLIYCIFYFFNFVINPSNENLIKTFFRLPIAVIPLVILVSVDISSNENRYIVQKNYNRAKFIFFWFMLYIVVDLVSILVSLYGEAELSNEIYSKRFWILGAVLAVMCLNLLFQKVVLCWKQIETEFNARVFKDTAAEILSLENSIEGDLEEVKSLMNESLKDNKTLILKTLNNIQSKGVRIQTLRKDLRRVRTK